MNVKSLDGCLPLERWESIILVWTDLCGYDADLKVFIVYCSSTGSFSTSLYVHTGDGLHCVFTSGYTVYLQLFIPLSESILGYFYGLRSLHFSMWIDGCFTFLCHVYITDFTIFWWLCIFIWYWIWFTILLVSITLLDFSMNHRQLDAGISTVIHTYLSYPFLFHILHTSDFHSLVLYISLCAYPTAPQYFGTAILPCITSFALLSNLLSHSGGAYCTVGDHTSIWSLSDSAVEAYGPWEILSL